MSGWPIWAYAIGLGVLIGLVLNLILWLAPTAPRTSSDRGPDGIIAGLRWPSPGA